MKILLVVTLLTGAVIAQNGQNGCQTFDTLYKQAEASVKARRVYEKNLQDAGYVLNAGDLEFGKSRSGLTCDNGKNFWLSKDGETADNLNTVAKIMSTQDPNGFANFGSFARCLNRNEVPLKKPQPKYRTFDGYGNNANHPTWGTPNTPYGRFVPKNYNDKISEIKRSVTGSELPNPRKLLKDVLLKAPKTPRTTTITNVLFILNELYISHDMAHQIPVETNKNCQEIRCCTHGNTQVLPQNLSHSACLPIKVDQDPFYSNAGIGCLNMVGSEPASLPDTIQYGEIRNKVTHFLDHSIIYGSDEEENKKLRSGKGGLLLLGKNDVLPVDSKGQFTSISDRLTRVPLSAIFPVLIARNHNDLATRLALLNPTWCDEKLFQEARRINIGQYEHIVFQKLFIAALGVGLSGTYNENIAPDATVEFITAAYRFFHTYMNSYMSLDDGTNNPERIAMSDTFKRIDLVQNRFDDVLRGVLNDKMNFGDPSDELYNKFAKNENNIGTDVFSIDIQRCRNHGMPSYLDTRRQCGLPADFTTFEDLLAIFPQTYVDLLKAAYQDVRDIDLYIGGTLETYLLYDQAFVGPTFICIIFSQFTNLIAGDAYYYSHKTSPYPFTDAQIAAIESFDFHNLICVNSGLSAVARNWILPPNNITNPLIPCGNYPQIDLRPWQNI